MGMLLNDWLIAGKKARYPCWLHLDMAISFPARREGDVLLFSFIRYKDQDDQKEGIFSFWDH